MAGNEREEQTPPDASRRNFIKIMGIVAVGAGALAFLRGGIQNIIPPSGPVLSGFPSMKLVDATGKAISTNSLQVNNPEIVTFDYPLLNEPNFLLRLGDSNNKDVAINPVSVTIPLTGGKFTSPGGAGPYKSIVASSAICQHLGCIPPEIRYHTFTSASFDGKIHCDCHGSTYDPFEGFKVVTGPTQRPLPNVILSHEGSDPDSDEYYVKSLVGPVIYSHTSDLSGGNPLPSTTETTVTQTTG
ncbi:MAG: Rieske 2Fe-2S domain-containing protein [Candidatus Thermoplasmatota archaeon]|jgi:Rieske Fe-S protein|nr:Rieske 2Fe-2S domain-containing protein [Candidatus Thermoplasmatota archaeon]MCL5791209.1 Rieske 2Fe-2S domain-containing protein [Candidatus Thermoplasmatota archaeon]